MDQDRIGAAQPKLNDDANHQPATSIDSTSSSMASPVYCSGSNTETEATSPITQSPPERVEMKLSMQTASYADFQKFQTRSLERLVESRDDEAVLLNGENLDLSSLVAVSRFGILAHIDDHPLIKERMQASVDFLKQELDAGHSIYGITTGFGGSADTNTDQFKDLQVALLQMQLCGILPEHGKAAPEMTGPGNPSLSYEAGLAAMSMPESWVRGAMLVRINSLIRGHSAVRPLVVESLAKLLQNNIVPFVPLHGSISASGDLSPLSYIAGALEGNPDVYVWTGPKQCRSLVKASECLIANNVEPIRFGPKEGLGILNGTAFSAAVAGLAMYEANNLALLAQVLTAMGVEALMGSTESFEPFIAAIRPHGGQMEVAGNIASSLAGSKLVQESRDRETRPLRQDRYALRTASQWLGPGLEDMLLATEQLEKELNSTTDNPLIDAASKRAFHGGNFQAASVTSSTEKTRLALQMIGKLLFAQSCELLDVKMNNGLPPNLALDEPSLSYTLKGVDINMAAYMAELGFLANPVSSHVQSAEMGNQSLNSMALVSARYTHKAVDIVSLMASAYLYSLCQALDLRAFHETYLTAFRPKFMELSAKCLGKAASGAKLEQWQNSIWSAFEDKLLLSVTKDSTTRFLDTAKSLQPLLLELLTPTAAASDQELWERPYSADGILIIQRFTSELATAARDVFLSTRESYAHNPDATPYLGRAARRMYVFVREELGVPIHKGLVDYPVAEDGNTRKGDSRLNTGNWISRIYSAMRDGRVAKAVRDSL